MTTRTRLRASAWLAMVLALACPLRTDAAVDPVGQWPLQPRPDVVARFDPPATTWGPGHRGADLAGRPGYGFLFEKGRYDGFSPDDVRHCLIVTDDVCPSIADYQFTHVTRLARDFALGRFAEAFGPRER